MSPDLKQRLDAQDRAQIKQDERLLRIEKKQDETLDLIRGDGEKPGLTGRMDRMDHRQTVVEGRQDGWSRFMWLLIAGGVYLVRVEDAAGGSRFLRVAVER